jgi:hypothetical protein
MTRPASREERITLWAVVGRDSTGVEWLDNLGGPSKDEAIEGRDWRRIVEPEHTFVLRPITAVLKLSKPRARKGAK